MKALSCRSIRFLTAIFTLAAAGRTLHAQDPAPNSSTNRPIDLDTPRVFPRISSAREWDQKATEIRQQVLVSCSLWPMPEKTPLKPQIFGKIERDGYTVEKVYFETWPGLYLAGNLYCPAGRGHGPFPGILNPHGHWSN